MNLTGLRGYLAGAAPAWSGTAALAAGSALALFFMMRPAAASSDEVRPALVRILATTVLVVCLIFLVRNLI